MKIICHPKIIFRVPLFPLNAKLETCWPELKEAIALSSPDFYNTIKNVDINDPGFEDAPYFKTIWKYFNRARHRATPFGNFAGFGIIPLQTRNPNAPVIARTTIRHRFPDWTMKDQVSFTFKELIDQDRCLFANSTHYVVKTSIRFVIKREGGFQLAEIDCEEIIHGILHFTRAPRPISSILQEFETSIQNAELLSVLEYLVDNQLLLASTQPNIVGMDYFKRIRQFHKGPVYMIAERSLEEGNIQASLFRHVPALIEKLKTLIPPMESATLSAFITRFQKKFEQQWIPIMIALDPELGVGYGDLEHADLEDDFIGELLNKETPAGNSNPFKSLLVNAMTANRMDKKAIDIEHIKGQYSYPDTKFPNSFSLLGESNGNMFQVAHLGNCTANSLLGRFTLASNQIKDLCREHARTEQEANPEVLFFDVGYMSEGYVDNINRRASIYQLQLNILSYDTSNEPLTMDDIYICVNAGQLILKSKRLNKRLIPRIANAYNFQRSDLSAFRLLCDVQHQGLHSNLNLNIDKLIPELDYFPEITYRNLVLSAQKWRVHFLNEFSELKALKKHIQRIGASRHVRVGNGDQTLVYDLSSDAELELLRQFLQKHRSAILEEFTFPKHAVFKDGRGRGYQHELLVSLTHHEPIYYAMQGFDININTGGEIALPGKEWLYFEIFCHPFRSDSILANQIKELLLNFEKEILSWFFIRYNEGGEHLRLRLKLRDPDHTAGIIQRFSELLNDDIYSGVVSDLRIRTYKREIQRYGALLIGTVESHFHIDSKIVMQILEAGLTYTDRYKLCTSLINEVSEAGIFSEEQFEFVIQKICGAFKKEYNFGAGQYKLLNERYRSFQKVEFLNANPAIAQSFIAMANSLILTLRKCPEYRKGILFSDLVHMHINRLFPSEQRMHEAVIYYFYSKQLLKLKALSVGQAV